MNWSTYITILGLSSWISCDVPIFLFTILFTVSLVLFTTGCWAMKRYVKVRDPFIQLLIALYSHKQLYNILQGQIKGQYILYCPATRAISRHCLGTRAISRYCPGTSFLWSTLWSVGCWIRYFQFSKPCNFYLWYPVLNSNNHSKCCYTNCCWYIWTGAHFRWVS